MNRRAILAGAVFIGLASAFGAAALGTQDSRTAQEQTLAALPQLLNSTTLAQYPDSKETIDAILASDALRGKYVIVEFVAGWCPHCARLKPEMDAAYASLRAAGANIARLTIVYQEGDAATGQRGAYAYRNTFRAMTRTGGFPEVHIIRDGVLVGGFSGAYPRAAIETYLRDIMTPHPAQTPGNSPG